MAWGGELRECSGQATAAVVVNSIHDHDYAFSPTLKRKATDYCHNSPFKSASLAMASASGSNPPNAAPPKPPVVVPGIGNNIVINPTQVGLDAFSRV